jgi:hypothetical protein
MATTQEIDWRDVEGAGRALAGAWQDIPCFCWHRGYNLEDADQWCIWYTSHRDSGLLDQSNEKVFNERLEPFSEDNDPDVVFERHSHFAVGHIDGFTLRVSKPDGTITPVFEEFCRIKKALEDYPILNEQDYTEMKYQATLENYRSEMWSLRKELPEGWEAEVYSWFCDNGLDRFTENKDDQGGWAPNEKILEALKALGLLPTVVVER